MAKHPHNAASLRDLILAAVPADGSGIGNAKLVGAVGLASGEGSDTHAIDAIWSAAGERSHPRQRHGQGRRSVAQCDRAVKA